MIVSRNVSLLVLFLCTVLSVSCFAQQSWSDPATWVSGTIPLANEDVVIPEGKHVVVDRSTPNLGNVTIFGVLEFADTDLAFTAKTLSVEGGVLRMGTEADPITADIVLTINGPKSEERTFEGPPGTNGPVGRYIMVMMNGRIEIHGASRDHTSWTQLNASVQQGATQIRLKDAPVGWRAGDEIALASSSIYGDQAEKLTITSVEGNILTFEPPLAYEHFGELQEFGSFDLDERAEVALLSRNIKIQGPADQANESEGYGAHLMIMSQGEARIEGAEFYRMGQKGRKARYPMHWHYAGDRPTDYAKNNSIHKSNHRALVIHGTNQFTASYNVAYDVFSHTYVPAEDGNEYENKFYYNLGMLTKKLPKPDFAFPNDNGDSFQSEHRPGTFWLKNTFNELVGNRAAGSMYGMGFFFDVRYTGREIRLEQVDRLDDPIVFKDNVAHSNYREASGNAVYGASTVGYGIFSNDDNDTGALRVFEGSTTYKNAMSGTWIEGKNILILNSISADNGSGHMLFQSMLKNSVIVGQSDNMIGGTPPVPPLLKKMGAIHLTRRHGGPKRSQLENVQIFNQRDAAITSRENSLLANSFSTNITMENVERPFLYTIEGPGMGFADKDGSLSGYGPSLIVGIDSDLVTNKCVKEPTWSANVCPLEDYNVVFFEKFGKENNDFQGLRLNGSGQSVKTVRAKIKLGPSEHYRYAYLFSNQPFMAVNEIAWSSEFDVRMQLQPNTTNDLALPYIGTDVVLKYGAEEIQMTALGSMEALQNTDITAYYYNANTNTLHLKFIHDPELELQQVKILHSPDQVKSQPKPAGTPNYTEEELNNNITLFPNPNKDGILYFEYGIPINETVWWQLFDNIGKLVGTGSVEAGIDQIDIGTKASGVYIIDFSTPSKGQFAVKKVLVE